MVRIWSLWLVLVSVPGAVPGAVWAEVVPHPLCSDGMVLQQKGPANLWGKAAKGEKVTVTFRGHESAVAADDQGNWKVSVPAGEPGGPFPMTIKGDKQAIDYKNVYVGEVWVCSGQSNMEWTIGACNDTDKKSAKDTPASPLLRVFTIGRNAQAEPVYDVKGSWIVPSPENVLGISATAYFFGRDLQQSRKVPVGLISTSWGGTRAEAWTCKSVLEKIPGYENDIKPVPTVGPNTAGSLFYGMIHPIVNAKVKGAIWYQGESNAGKAYHYRELFPAMINAWREAFNQPELPFFFVQLAPYTPRAEKPGESRWAELREAQLMALKLKNTGMAVITDYGDELDIHPTPKQPVGERLSLAARATVYGEKIEYSGPIYQALKVDGNKAVLTFTHTGTGLVAKALEPTNTRKNKAGVEGSAWRVNPSSGNAKLVGFTVCGEDKVFHEATAEIVGDTVVVTSANVQIPVAVRYGWADHPVCNLFNKEGLPASPFRTDTFPGITQPK